MEQVCVVGLGHVGLPSALLLANAGFRVHGFDVDTRVVEAVLAGTAIPEEPGVPALLDAMLRNGRITASTSAIPADVYVVAVPTPCTSRRVADVSYVEAAARAITPHLRRDALVILESTVPVGTTDTVLCPLLAESGLVVGPELSVAFCPERAIPGDLLRELAGNARVVGGVTERCGTRAREFYARAVAGEIRVTSCRTAEMVKLLENSYRDVNIAFANEAALLAEQGGVDFWEARSLANLHPRVDILAAGPGVGGHCIPVDPHFLREIAPQSAPLLMTSRQVNDGMAEHVVSMVLAMMAGRPGKVAVLGLTYKRGTADTRESPSLRVLQGLAERGCQTAATDPLARRASIPVVPVEEALSGSDCVVVMVDHQEYADLDPWHVAPLVNCKRIIDARCCIDMDAWRAAGFTAWRLGSSVGR